MDKIYNYLIELGANASHNGFNYLHDAIEKTIKNKEFSKNPMMILYNEIAEKYDVQFTSVERCMRRTIECIFKNPNCDCSDSLNFIFKNSNAKNGKLTNSNFIALSALYLSESNKK